MLRLCVLLLLETVLVLELLNTTAALSELLLSSKERMASGANVSSDFFLGGLCHERIAACASNFTFLELRMDSLFHAFHLFPRSGHLPLRIKITLLSVTACIIYHTKAGQRKRKYHFSQGISWIFCSSDLPAPVLSQQLVQAIIDLAEINTQLSAENTYRDLILKGIETDAVPIFEPINDDPAIPGIHHRWPRRWTSVG